MIKMSENHMRTLLEEFRSEGKESPLENGHYGIIAGRLPESGGSQCNVVKARKMDNHYLLIRAETVRGWDYEPFGIVDLDQPEEAAERMYQEAKRLAEERAKFDGSKVLDLTSRVKEIPAEARHYVSILDSHPSGLYIHSHRWG